MRYSALGWLAALVTIQGWISAFDDPWEAIRLASALADSVADGQAPRDWGARALLEGGILQVATLQGS